MEAAGQKKHYVHSSLREKIVEHLFVGEVLRSMWCRDRLDIEILKSEFDAHGYDVVFNLGNVTRYIQLKAGVKKRPQDVTVSRLLESKPGSCVVWISVDEELRFRSFYYYGSGPNEPLPSLDLFRAKKHTKPNSDGVKADRQNHKKVPISQFKIIPSMDALLEVLFPQSPTLRTLDT